jgi:hypothetical protein
MFLIALRRSSRQNRGAEASGLPGKKRRDAKYAKDLSYKKYALDTI